jgi:hypothetical protein
MEWVFRCRKSCTLKNEWEVSVRIEHRNVGTGKWKTVAASKVSYGRRWYRLRFDYCDPITRQDWPGGV